MAALSTLAMMALSAGQTASQFITTRRQASLAEKQGEAVGGQFDVNAGLARAQAEDAITRGDQAAEGVERSARLVGGAQTTAAAAAGVDVGSGSVQAVKASDQRLSAVDQAMIKYNASREAWGFNVEAQNYTTQGLWARESGRNEAAALREQSVGTLLSGAGNLAQIYATAPKGISRTGWTPPDPEELQQVATRVRVGVMNATSPGWWNAGKF